MKVIKRNGKVEEFNKDKLLKVLKYACEDFPRCDVEELLASIEVELKDGIKAEDIQRIAIQVAVEKIDQFNPDWQFVSGRLLTYDLYKRAAISRNYSHFGYGNFYDLIKVLTEKEVYGKYILENYSKEEIDTLADYIKPERDKLFNYVGLKLLTDRYLAKDKDGKTIYELPQERFMIIAMNLAMKETKNRLLHVMNFYDIMSKHEVMVATPTLNNGGKTHPQLSSCFIDTVSDSLDGIMDVAHSSSRVSKHGGGVGIYLGKIRGTNAPIRGYANASGGVIPWTRIYNQIAVSVDQLGQRAGAFALYLDIWHKDILNFLELKTNNGDDRMKAHDIFPGVCIPDIFMEAVKNRDMWYLFEPYEVHQKMGFYLEDSYDDVDNKEFSRRYNLCVEAFKNDILDAIEIPAIEIMKKIMASAFETGTPFIFFRDEANRANPNKDKGMIYCSNLCTEIFQNMSPTEIIYEEIEMENGDYVIVTKHKPGDFVVCNLSSLNLSKVESEEDLARIIPVQMRMLDNVIDLNFYPVKQAEITNRKYRPVGLGIMGYHHWIAKNKIKWESDEHVEAVDKLFENIAYYTIKSSMELAKEKGAYPLFKGSEWENGKYFERRGYVSDRWRALSHDVAIFGMRNAWTQATAPTSSISVITNSTAGIDPIYKRLFMQEKKGIMIPEAPPEVDKYFAYYKEAHTIDQSWSIKAAGIRAKHIDQGQSFNLYITPEIDPRKYLSLYIEAWEAGLKSIYYVRNESLEVEECVSCAN